jgi:hypothetical protein
MSYSDIAKHVKVIRGPGLLESAFLLPERKETPSYVSVHLRQPREDEAQVTVHETMTQAAVKKAAGQ